MILNSIAEKLKRQSKDNFKGRHLPRGLEHARVKRCLIFEAAFVTVAIVTRQL